MDEESRTLYVGNLHENATQELLYELFLQAGPIERISRPVDRATGKVKNFAFVVFNHSVSVPYAVHLTNGIMLFNQPLKTQQRGNIDLPHYNSVGVHTINSEEDIERSLNGSKDESFDSAYYSGSRKHDRSFRPKPLDPKRSWQNALEYHEHSQSYSHGSAMGLSQASMTPSSNSRKRSRHSDESAMGPFGARGNAAHSASHYHNLNSQILDGSSNSAGQFDLRSTLAKSSSTSQLPTQNYYSSSTSQYGGTYYGNHSSPNIQNNSYGGSNSYSSSYGSSNNYNSNYGGYYNGASYDNSRHYRNSDRDGSDGRDRKRSRDNRYYQGDSNSNYHGGYNNRRY